MKAKSLSIAALVALAGCGGARTPATRVQVVVHWGAPASRPDETFTLTCGPPGGTLPEAVRICTDIARHPRATLQPPRDRWVCGGAAGGPVLAVTIRAHGSTRTLTGQPGCGWPTGTALALYWAASRRDTRALGRIEPTLRCGEDPRLLARPTPLASAVACVHGRWTPRTERLIRAAVQVVPLASPPPERLFPRDVGVQACTFERGGLGSHTMRGRCGVNVANVWSRPVVTFVEAWGPPGRVRRARWVVAVRGSRARLVAHSGSVPPQDWM